MGSRRGDVGCDLSDRFSFHFVAGKPIEIWRGYCAAVADAEPVGWINAAGDPFLEGGMRSEMRAGDEAVFYGVVVDVIEVFAPIGFVLDGVFPEAFLPDAAVAVTLSGNGLRHLDTGGG